MSGAGPATGAAPGTARRVHALVRPTGEGHAVTTLELFFDLVFVFALTQVTAFLAADLTARGALRGLLLLALLWFAWCSYAWLGNQARADEGLVRAAIITAMAAVFVIALAIPEAWDDADRTGLRASLALVVALAVVRFAHLGVYAVAAAGDAGLRRQLLRNTPSTMCAVLLLLVGARAGGAAQTGLWLLALAVDYAGTYAAGAGGWRLPAPRHFAERHGLIVIVAIGESIVAIGVGAAALPLTWAVALAAILGLAVSVALWWTYFDVVALVAERELARREGIDRTRLARDSYTYLHFPMIVGIVYLALGVKKVLEYVADTSHHALTDRLPGLPLAALYGGVVLYLLAHLAFRARNVGSINRPRLTLAAALLLLAPAAARLPALGALALLAALLTGLVTYEALRYAQARDAIRHGAH